MAWSMTSHEGFYLSPSNWLRVFLWVDLQLCFFLKDEHLPFFEGFDFSVSWGKKGVWPIYPHGFGWRFCEFFAQIIFSTFLTSFGSSAKIFEGFQPEHRTFALPQDVKRKDERFQGFHPQGTISADRVLPGLWSSGLVLSFHGSFEVRSCIPTTTSPAASCPRSGKHPDQAVAFKGLLQGPNIEGYEGSEE